MKFLEFCVFPIVFAYFFSACNAYTAAEIYGSLPDEDKGHFLRYYLAKGFLESETTDAAIYPGMSFPNDLQIPEDTIKVFEQFDIEPKTFPQQLLNKYCNKLNLTRYELFYGVMASCGVCNCNPCDQYICIPQTGACINNGDNGGICCT